MEDIEDSSEYHFIRGNIAGWELVDKFFRQGFGVVISFAAESDINRSIFDFSPFVKTNVGITQVLLGGVKQYVVKLLVQISTNEVYGSLGATGKFTEESLLLSNSPYAASKTAVDCLCQAYYNVPIVFQLSL